MALPKKGKSAGKTMGYEKKIKSHRKITPAGRIFGNYSLTLAEVWARVAYRKKSANRFCACDLHQC